LQVEFTDRTMICGDSEVSTSLPPSLLTE